MTASSSSLVRSSLFLKTNDTLNSVARNTSCSRGWLHLVVQVTFGAITVASFILIMLMTFQSSSNSQSPCKTTNCRITCSDKFYSDDEIIAAILASESDCVLKLTLRNPMFQNGVMPANWLDEVPYNIETISIVGGNLQHIENNAFMAQFASHLKTLMLENITISSWTSDTFVGLVELNFLRITNCQLRNIRQDALRAVGNTITTLTITGSGIWNPANITGSAIERRIRSNLKKLTVVNFSSNTFGNILGPSSFTGLESCKDLYLNSCGITAIANGTFDSLNNIEMLFLNNNFLITLPSGLFSKIIQIQSIPKPRINLQNNFWHCDCSQSEIMKLSKEGLLLVDPTCYHPLSTSGKPVSGLEEFCNNRTKSMNSKYNVDWQLNLDYDMNKECYYGKEPLNNLALQIVSPLPLFRCPLSNVSSLNRHSNKDLAYLKHGVETVSDNSWLRPEFLLRYNDFSMMQIASSLNDTGVYGLLFHQSECPNEIYCFNILPSVLRLYDVNSDSKYTFCPLNLFRESIELDKCINYDVSDVQSLQQQHMKYTRPFMYALTGLLCLVFGAVLVYSIVRSNPYLLKGSKRLLFVKHRNVDALVLPPKIPLRTSLSKEVLVPDSEKVYTVSNDTKLLYPCHLLRTNSVRSDKSSSPTYVSAMQPTDAQLAEWRLRHHFDKNVSITSLCSEASIYGWACENDINSTNMPYENFK